jgi:putative nucleotidyltransferase with HDIG domain
VRGGPTGALKCAAAGLLATTAAGAAVSSRAAEWRPLWLFLTLLVLGLLGDRVHARTGGMRLSGGLTIVGLAMALLGPAPAVTISALSRIFDAVLTDGPALRGRRLALAWNLAMSVNVLAGSLIIRGAVDAGVSRGSAAYALVVVGAISVANVINFVLAAVWIRARGGPTVGAQVRGDFLPAVAWIATPNVLIAALVTLYIRAGRWSLLLALAVLGAFYMLLAQLLDSQQRRAELEQRRAELEQRTLQLASLQVGVLVTMVRTLSMRDKFTARHSAAVARYAHAIARAAGCDEDQLRTVHTAGLLHDIGKFAFPDHILLADGHLAEADLEVVRAHPIQGAELVRTVQGLEEVAAVILAHHERVDGTGYPHALRREQIPALARMISVGDVYDVLTARDTYCSPVSRAQAIVELRRVSGTQLDGEFVELFVAILEREQLGFTHTEAADFEAELAIEQRILELAKPRALSSAPAGSGVGGG